MSSKARLYIAAVTLAGCFLAAGAFLSNDLAHPEWLSFAILVILASISQILKSCTPSNQSYHPALIFLFAGVIMLQPRLFVLLVIISHLIEWAVQRLMIKGSHLQDWYIQPFNISMHILIGLAAQWVYQLILTSPINNGLYIPVLAAIAAALIYSFLNHLMVGWVLLLARRVSWKQSGILRMENLLTDLVMLLMGSVLAVSLELNPWFILPVLSPFYLIYRALSVPSLKQQANIDSKTGLWNDRYFKEALEKELARAQRLNRPMTIVMADLDLLRNINNTFGHISGDAVLIGVAQILKSFIREYDIVARLGGEEFSILFPETCPEDAYLRIEEIRRKIESTEFRSPTVSKPIRATMSFGIAGRTGLENSAKEIIHNADVAVYQAKIQGRNRTVAFSQQAAHELGIFEMENCKI
jgi:diguanylate cyclase (GGDEF)-like protein